MCRKGLVGFRMWFIITFLMVAVVWGGTPASADQITIDLPKTDVNVVKDADGYAKFFGENFQYLSQPGEPAIPYIVVKALLPPGSDLSTVEVEVQRSAVQSEAVQSAEEWRVRPMPVPEVNPIEEPVLNASGEDEAVYNTSIRFPYSLVGGVSTGEIWEWQLVDIPIALFQFNPVTQRLYTLDASQAIIKFQHKTRRSATRISSDMGRDRVRNLAVNYNQMESEYPVERTRRSLSNEKSSYVVITTNAIYSTSSQIDAFAQHKESRGYAVRVITENIWGGGTGDFAAENIRNWLKENYEALNIEYVLLIGNPHPENGDVPMKMLWPRNNATLYTQYTESPSDYYYADLTGNWDLDGDGKYGEEDDDFGPGGVDRNFEVIVGRIPYYGNINELDGILNKIISYQNDPNQDWRKHVLLPMEPSDSNTPGYHLGEAIKENVIVPTGWNYYRVYDSDYGLSPLPEKTPCNVDNVSTAWNAADYGAVFWWTHGWEKGASDIMDLSHAAMLDDAHPSFTFQCSCTNSHPETTTNLSYALLKNGAIATLGATRVSWYYVQQTDFPGRTSNASMTYEYAKRLIKDGMKCGYALHDMKQKLVPGIWMNFTDFCLYGDPEVSIIEDTVTDNPPVISNIPDQTTQRDVEITVPFTVSDDTTLAADLELSITSSDPAIVPAGNISIVGSSEDRTLDIEPAQGKTGSSTITVTVRDKANNATDESFVVSVNELAEWQVMNPLPHGSTFFDVWGSSEDDVYAVGENGTIFHYNGIVWQQMESNFSFDLNALWGTSASDVFAVGEKGLILHYDGNQWSEMESGIYDSIIDIWGNSHDNVYAITYSSILHYDGSVWKEIDFYTISGSLDSIWVSQEGDIFVGIGYAGLGYTGIIYHYDGSTWNKQEFVDSQSIEGIWGISENSVFAIDSYQSKIFYYDGSIWSEMYDIPLQLAYPTSIWGTSSDNIFVAGGSDLEFGYIYHYDGNTWSRLYDDLDIPNYLYGVWGSSQENFFAVGEFGSIFQNENNQILKRMPEEVATTNNIRAIWGSSPSSIYAVANYDRAYDPFHGTILHYNGNSWTVVDDFNFDAQSLNDIWGSSANDIYAVGSCNRYEWDYEGRNCIFHFDGAEWTELGPDFNEGRYNGVWGDSADNVFFVGSNDYRGLIVHYDGNEWIQEHLEESELLSDIWGSSENDIYAVGEDRNDNEGIILHYNGNSWQEIKRVSSGYFLSVWCDSATDVYVLGYIENNYVVLHFDGDAWNTHTIPGNAYTIWGTSENDVFAAGEGIFHYDGTKWTTLTEKFSIYGIWGSSGNDVYAAGQSGAIVHYTPPTEDPVLSITPASQSVPASSGTSDFAIANAGTGTLSWQASENESWFSVDPASGGNSGTLTVTYDANSGEERTGTITVVAEGAANSPKTITLIQAQKAGPHFTPVWTGNPYNSMVIRVVGASSDGTKLSNGDEIAVFDGNKCVGAGIVSGEITTTDRLDIITSQDDGSGNGFLAGHEIAFRIWDASLGVEKTQVISNFKNITDGNPIDPPGFTPNGDYGVILEAGNQQHDLSMNEGWNIMSFPIIPEETDMLNIVQPLIDSGQLVKVIDEQGKRILQVFGQWENEIGNYESDEGYQIKLTSNASLSVRGSSVLSQSNMYAASQKDIFLSSGWNIMSYPFNVSRDAMDVFQPLIESGVLVKAINEQGNRILQIFGQWENEIGNLEPGDGYQVKINSDTWLSIKEPDSLQRRSPIQQPRQERSAGHFTPIWTGNPYNSMSLRIIAAEGDNVSSGDEIGIFDGDKCVGVGVISGEVSVTNRVDIVTSQDDGDGSGFTPGNSIDFRFWDSDRDTEIIDITTEFLDIATGNTVPAPSFESNGDYGVRLGINHSLDTGYLIVTITPDAANSNGAKWRVDGTEYSSEDVATLSAGTYTISFTNVTAYDAPADQSIAITSGDTESLTVSYTPTQPDTGALTVNITPAEAIAAGARWRVDEIDYGSGDTATLSAGTYTVTFTSVAGYDAPEDQSVSITPGGAESLTAVYTPTQVDTGSVTVTITPDAAIAAGAKWGLDDGATWQNSSATVTALAAGSYTITFKTVDLWDTPIDQTIMVASGDNAIASGVYTRNSYRLSEAIAILQILCGIDADISELPHDPSENGDGKIGIEDAVYILRFEAGLR